MAMGDGAKITWSIGSPDENGPVGMDGQAGLPGSTGPSGNSEQGDGNMGMTGAAAVAASGPQESVSRKDQLPQNAGKEFGYTKWRGIYYKAFNTHQKSFSDAAATCREDGGTLAMPRDYDTDSFLISLTVLRSATAQHPQSSWFGLKRRYRGSSEFEWVDGTPLRGGYTGWRPNEPNNANDNEDCVHYSGDADRDGTLKVDAIKWNDYECQRLKFFICQVLP
ncbi:PREDICTED: C-type lectin mannose-binding isoform-like [Branchiostoma belcheri]|uniref:C-type lectin mannose-binding isoform-like n=1 Tax=Branchiostoma belcheri TaxID=7741 RepID=A0A6P4XUJ4_BRABE|nr:PREDICTED: C-type lectin mannose-binding isoform-like [Branchiostoma belcheri]